jgi:hypothetical protein
MAGDGTRVGERKVGGGGAQSTQGRPHGVSSPPLGKEGPPPHTLKAVVGPVAAGPATAHPRG